MRKLLFAMILMQSCVTINVCEKPKLACVISDKHDCGKAIYADAPTFLPNNAVRTVHHSEIPDWLKNCDTTFKN